MKRSMKSVMGNVLMWSGFWKHRVRMWARRGEAIVLAYHRVLEKWDRTLDYSQPGLVVTADTFDRQLSFLKEHFNIVPLSALVNPKSAIRNSKPLCSITFDDGWRDNYEIAFPILRQHGVPATIFLTTDFIGATQTFWHTELMYLLMHGDSSRFRLVQYVVQAYPTPVGRHWTRLVRSPPPPTSYELDPLIEAVKTTCSEDEITCLIRDLRHALGTAGLLLSHRRFFLDWDQVREMAGAGIEIGSHGCSHRILTRISIQDAKEELIRSKAEIEGRTGQRVCHFAFPEGAANRPLMSMAGEVGYRVACLCGGDASLRQGVPLPLRRAGMHEGVSLLGNGSLLEAGLSLWLLRAPKARVA